MWLYFSVIFGGFVSSCIVAQMLLSVGLNLVDHILWWRRFIWTLSVAGASLRYLTVAWAVSPGYVVN